ncbi:hypothetical protein Cenrod_1880 [Candidatus Symbiobacter mobilis CR]|uniref:Uncharacterized protein n=1 Tax=Candidatus Symbiobacter mobilis CR TaxID=946483 RepID=U5N9G9_9BURK|nr:hypothetical protein Cenrod_1880 [Candidatus Symbiobacter mobilis CR]
METFYRQPVNVSSFRSPGCMPTPPEASPNQLDSSGATHTASARLPTEIGSKEISSRPQSVLGQVEQDDRQSSKHRHLACAAGRVPQAAPAPQPNAPEIEQCLIGSGGAGTAWTDSWKN